MPSTGSVIRWQPEFLRFRAQRGTFAQKIAQYRCLVSLCFRLIFAFRPENQDPHLISCYSSLPFSHNANDFRSRQVTTKNKTIKGIRHDPVMRRNKKRNWGVPGNSGR